MVPEKKVSHIVSLSDSCMIPIKVKSAKNKSSSKKSTIVCSYRTGFKYRHSYDSTLLNAIFVQFTWMMKKPMNYLNKKRDNSPSNWLLAIATFKMQFDSIITVNQLSQFHRFSIIHYFIHYWIYSTWFCYEAIVVVYNSVYICLFEWIWIDFCIFDNKIYCLA